MRQILISHLHIGIRAYMLASDYIYLISDNRYVYMCMYNVTIINIFCYIDLTIKTILFDSKISVDENKYLLDGNFILRVHIARNWSFLDRVICAKRTVGMNRIELPTISKTGIISSRKNCKYILSITADI